jgi:hypothetical protein
VEDLVFVKTFSCTSLLKPRKEKVKGLANAWIGRHRGHIGRSYVDLVIKRKFLGIVTVAVCSVFYSHPSADEE